MLYSKRFQFIVSNTACVEAYGTHRVAFQDNPYHKTGYSMSISEIFLHFNFFRVNHSLKALRNLILRIILVWSLLWFMQVFILYNFIWKTSFSSFCAFCVFCFESNVLNQDIKMCVLMLYNFGYPGNCPRGKLPPGQGQGQG